MGVEISCNIFSFLNPYAEVFVSNLNRIVKKFSLNPNAKCFAPKAMDSETSVYNEFLDVGRISELQSFSYPAVLDVKHLVKLITVTSRKAFCIY